MRPASRAEPRGARAARQPRTRTRRPARPAADRRSGRTATGWSAGARRRRDQALPMSRLRPGTAARHRARGGLAGRRRPDRTSGGTGTMPAGSGGRAGRDRARRRTGEPGGISEEAMTEITASTVLPARREHITLRTSDGLTLVGELALPEARPPVATLICLHPLPTHGGMMDSHVLRKAAYRLPALADLAVLRFNTRGTTSERGTQRGRVRRGRDRAARRGGGHRLLRRPWPAAAVAARLVVRHRARAALGQSIRTSRAPSCCRRRCAGPGMPSLMPGPAPASHCSRWCRSTMITSSRAEARQRFAGCRRRR